MAVTPFDPSKLNEAELENDPSLIGSIMAGIATGLIRIQLQKLNNGLTKTFTRN